MHFPSLLLSLLACLVVAHISTMTIDLELKNDAVSEGVLPRSVSASPYKAHVRD